MLTLTLRRVLAVIVVGGGLVLAACGGTASTDPSGTTPSTPTPTATAAAVAKETPEHIHNLALVEGVVYLGTHKGMWMEQPDQSVV